MRPPPQLGPPALGESEVGRAKRELRLQLHAKRRLNPESSDDQRRRTDAAAQLSAGHQVLACYASLGDEPDTWGLLDVLHSQGVTVLLPLLRPYPDGSSRRHPDWAVFEGRTSLVPGFRGIVEPDGPSLGAAALSSASLIWCSGLAATAQGDRLGTGGGWYDRALAHAAADATCGILLRDDEVLPELPTEPWDRRVDLIVTPSRVIQTQE